MPDSIEGVSIEPHTVCDDVRIYYREILPPELVDLMVKELKQMEEDRVPFEDGGVGGDAHGRNDLTVRNSKVNWWYENHWACSVISHYINLANKKTWQYDLNTLESIQISVYQEGGHYGWHSDYGTSTRQNWTRKLSASVLVTDPSEYDGGDLVFIDYHGNEVNTPKEKGTILVFDSRIPHKVKKVTRGRRVSLVTWMYGPKLR